MNDTLRHTYGRYDQRTVRVRDLGAADWRLYLEFERWRVWCPRCRNVFVEQLDWLATNPRYTQRFGGLRRARAAQDLWRTTMNTEPIPTSRPCLGHSVRRISNRSWSISRFSWNGTSVGAQ